MRPIVRLATPLPNARHFTAGLATIALLSVAAPLAAQNVRIITRPDAERHLMVTRIGNDDRPIIGVTTKAESEHADTLGLRVESVQKGSPAEKAGLKEGDRVQAINGVSLRADRADAGEDDYSGVLNRRLQREVQRTKLGESVELRVLSGSQVRVVRVAPVKASDLAEVAEGGSMMRHEASDRPVLGLTITSTGSARDTLGVFVQAVTKDGPAEKAGIFEGDRIAAINGVSLRVGREDAEDDAVGAARAERLSREVAKLKAGESAELTVVTAGRTRTVRVTAVKASDLPGGGAEAFFLRSPGEEMIRMLPEGLGPMRIRVPEMPEGSGPMRIRIPEMRQGVEETLPSVQRLRQRRVIRTVL